MNEKLFSRCWSGCSFIWNSTERRSASRLTQDVGKIHFPIFLWVLEESELKILVTQSYPTLCDPMDFSPWGSSVHDKDEVGCHSLLQDPGDLPDPGIEPGSPAFRQILYRLNHWATREALLYPTFWLVFGLGTIDNYRQPTQFLSTLEFPTESLAFSNQPKESKRLQKNEHYNLM